MEQKIKDPKLEQELEKKLEEIRQQMKIPKPEAEPTPKKKDLKGKFKNKNISIDILGKSARSGEYMIQVKVLVNNRSNKELLDKLAKIDTCYRLTRNAFYTREALEALIKEHDLK